VIPFFVLFLAVVVPFFSQFSGYSLTSPCGAGDLVLIFSFPRQKGTSSLTFFPKLGTLPPPLVFVGGMFFFRRALFTIFSGGLLEGFDRFPRLFYSLFFLLQRLYFGKYFELTEFALFFCQSFCVNSASLPLFFPLGSDSFFGIPTPFCGSSKRRVSDGSHATLGGSDCSWPPLSLTFS